MIQLRRWSVYKQKIYSEIESTTTSTTTQRSSTKSRWINHENTTIHTTTTDHIIPTTRPFSSLANWTNRKNVTIYAATRFFLWDISDDWFLPECYSTKVFPFSATCNFFHAFLCVLSIGGFPAYRSRKKKI